MPEGLNMISLVNLIILCNERRFTTTQEEKPSLPGYHVVEEGLKHDP